jgi:hypothetical protein
MKLEKLTSWNFNYIPWSYRVLQIIDQSVILDKYLVKLLNFEYL